VKKAREPSSNASAEAAWRGRGPGAHGGAILRSRKGSGAAEGTPIHSTVSPFAGRHPRGISAGATSHEVLQTSRRIEPVTRVPEAPREGHARHRPRARGSPLLERFGPRSASSTRVELVGASRLVQVVARRPPMRQRTVEANATGIGWCRRAAGRKPHSRARIDGSSGCARASYQVAEVGRRRRGSEKRDSRWQRGAWTGARPSRTRKGREGEKASRTGIAVAKPRSRESPEPGAREGVAGRRSLSDGRHLGAFPRLASFTRASRRRSWRLPRVRIPRERNDTRGRGDRDVRGPVRTHRDGNNKPTAVTTRENVRPTEANRTDVRQAISPIAQARKRMTHREPARRGCSYEDVRRQKSVRRIARRDARGTARRIGDTALAEGYSAPTCWRTRRRLRGENGARGCAAHSTTKAFAAWAARATWSIVTRRKASRSLLAQLRKVRRGGGLGRAGECETRTARCAWSQLPVGYWNRRGGARDDDEGRQRSMTCTVKAAPADEARAVRHARRREALALEELRRGLRGRCESDTAIEWTLDGSIEAGRCEKLGHPARLPEPRERTRAGN